MSEGRGEGEEEGWRQRGSALKYPLLDVASGLFRLQDLQEASGAAKVTLNTRTGTVLIEGGADVYGRVRALVESCLAAEDLAGSLR